MQDPIIRIWSKDPKSIEPQFFFFTSRAPKSTCEHSRIFDFPFKVGPLYSCCFFVTLCLFSCGCSRLVAMCRISILRLSWRLHGSNDDRIVGPRIGYMMRSRRYILWNMESKHKMSIFIKGAWLPREKEPLPRKHHIWTRVEKVLARKHTHRIEFWLTKKLPSDSF